MRILLQNLTPSTTYAAQFRTIQGGQFSDWSSTFQFTTINDTTPPPVPSTPVVAATSLGQLRVTWDGLGSIGEAMPEDFSHVEVHASTTTGFTPSATTVRATMRAKGDEIITGVAYGTTYYIKLVSVDLVGNKSAGSAQGSGVPVRVSGLDVEALAIATTHLGDGAVTNAKIADATITSAKIGLAQILNANIANAAIDDAKIANVSAGKITASTLIADVTVASRIKTANTGARVELNSAGLEAYNSAGVKTVDIKGADGSATILGSFRTGVAGGGSSYMTIDDLSDRTTINFYNSTGTKYAFINSVIVGSSPALGMNSAEYTLTSPVVPGKSRLFLYENGIQLEMVRSSDQSQVGANLYLNHLRGELRFASNAIVNSGAVIFVTQDVASVRRESSGVSTGGEFYVDTGQAIMTQNNAGVATGGRFLANNTTAQMAHVAAGSNVHGITMTSSGVASFGTYTSSIGWTFVPGAKFDTGEFRMDRWGPFVAIHIRAVATAAVASGSSAEPIGTITSAGNLPLSETSMAAQHNGGTDGHACGAFVNSTGTVRLRWLSGAMAIGDNLRVSVCYFRS